MEKPVIRRENIVPLLEEKYIQVYDLQYAPGRHYLDATRRGRDRLVCTMPDAEMKEALPDAVTCVVILCVPGSEPRLLLSYEYRYPAGRFLLSPPAGLIDPEDAHRPEPLLETARREIAEETGLSVGPGDTLRVISPFAFSSPGMTDESNAMVCAVLRPETMPPLSQAGAVGSECFDGFELVDEGAARALLASGRDRFGTPYSIYTWAALMWFVSGGWR